MYRAPGRRVVRAQLESAASAPSAASTCVAGASRSPPTSPRGSSELFAREAAAAPATERRLTAVGDTFAAGRELVAAERFTAVSRDGSEVDAWVMKPGRLRARQAVPDAAQRPRRAVRPVRRRLLRRVPGVLPAPATWCSSPTRAARAARTRPGAGPSAAPARPDPAGARSTTRTAWPWWTTRSPRSTSSTPSASASSAAPTAAS